MKTKSTHDSSFLDMKICCFFFNSCQSKLIFAIPNLPQQLILVVGSPHSNATERIKKLNSLLIPGTDPRKSEMSYIFPNLQGEQRKYKGKSCLSGFLNYFPPDRGTSALSFHHSAPILSSLLGSHHYPWLKLPRKGSSLLSVLDIRSLATQ